MKSLATVVASVAFAALILAPTAAAATEFGSNCTGEEGEPGFTVFDLSHSASEPLPASAPVSGVITQGMTTFKAPTPPVGIAVVLQVYRPAGGDQFTLVGQAPAAAVSPGKNSFATRIPVQAGDHLGYSVLSSGDAVGLFCRTFDTADQLAYTEQPPSLGGTGSFGVADEYRAPLAAVIEPDADKDGYGDETQDGCPQSAAFQSPCPVIVLDASAAAAGRNGVTVRVAASSEGPVSVSGVVGLGKGKKATLNAGPKVVAAGTTASFRLKFPGKLKKRLKKLDPSKKLTLKITTSATNLTGSISTDALKVKLKGQG